MNTLKQQEEELIGKTLELITSIGKDEDVDEIKKVQASFRVLQFV
jgi:hypothetical protein